MKFGEKLIQARLIDKAQLDSALSHQGETGLRLGEALLELGYVSEDDLLKFLAKEFKTRFVSTRKLSRISLPAGLLEMVPQKLAEKYLIFPVLINRKTTTIGVVTCEPQNQRVIEELRILSRMQNVQFFVAMRDAIKAALKKHYKGDIHAFAAIERTERRKSAPPMAPPTDPMTGELDIQVEPSAPPKASGPAVVEPDPSEGFTSETTSSWTRKIEEVRGGSLVSDNDFIETLNILVGLLEMQRTDLRGHSAQVARWTKAISERLGMKERDINNNIIAAYLHELGKRASVHLTLMSIAKSDEHRKRARRYHLTPARLFDSVHLSPHVNHIIGHLYESFDGTGLPEQLSGEGIPSGAKIIAVADAYEDLVSNPANPFGKTLGVDEALAEIRKNSERLFDPQMVQMLCDVIQGQATRDQLGSSSPLVLVADPDSASTSEIELKLVKNGFRVRVARDSQTAQESLQSEPVEALLVEMRIEPDDGFAILAFLESEGKDIPVFMTSTDTSPAAVTRAFDCGVADFVTKPYMAEVLIAKIKKELSRRVSAPSGEDAPPGDEEISAEVVIEMDEQSMPGPPSGTMAGVVSTGAKILSGSLEGKSALALIKALSGKRKSGLLSLRMGEHKGMIYFEAGHVFQAMIGEVQAEEAFLEMASWRDCLYRFDPSKTARTRAIKTPTGKLFQIADLSS